MKALTNILKQKTMISLRGDEKVGKDFEDNRDRRQTEERKEKGAGMGTGKTMRKVKTYLGRIRRGKPQK